MTSATFFIVYVAAIGIVALTIFTRTTKGGIND